MSPSRTLDACAKHAGLTCALVRMSKLDIEGFLSKATAAGFKGKLDKAKKHDQKAKHDPVVVLTRGSYAYTVVLAGALVDTPFELGTFGLKVGSYGPNKFSLLWIPVSKDSCRLLVRSHETHGISAQLQLTVNGHVKLLEPHGRCTLPESEAVGFEFPCPRGEARLSIAVLQTSNGQCCQNSNTPEPLDIATLQGRWHSDRNNMTFQIEGTTVILLNPRRPDTASSTPEHFGTLQYGIGKHGWLRLHSFQMISNGTTKDRICWQQVETKNMIAWRRSPSPLPETLNGFEK